MKIFPSTVPSRNQPGGSTITGSEREVFALFKQSKYPEANAFHSLRFLDAGARPFGQTDFLLVGPKGVVIFEVKGGAVRKREDGAWVIGSEDGRHYVTQESPLDQAARNSMSIRDWLDSRADLNVKGVPFGHAVILPYQEGTVKGLDVVPEIVATRKNCIEPSTFARWLTSCCDYWWRKKGFLVDALSTVEIEHLVSLLRGKFEVEPSFDLRTGAVLDYQDTISAEQVRVLDAAETLARIIVTGGAGSGKSFVIRALARRYLEVGKQVGILIPRPELKRIYPGFEESGGRFYVGRHDGEPSETLLVDEGQDFCNELGLETIDRCVVGGMSGGRWRVFLDNNLQASLRGLWRSEDFDLLKLYADGVVLNLADNYRNTDKIVTKILLAVPAKIGRAQVSAGIECLQFEDGPERVATVLKKMFARGTNWHQMCVAVLADPASVLTALAAADVPHALTIDEQGVLVATPEYIQGLEYPHVVVFFDTPYQRDSAARFYVAASRARASLTLVDPTGVYLRLVEDNIQ